MVVGCATSEQTANRVGADTVGSGHNVAVCGSRNARELESVAHERMTIRSEFMPLLLARSLPAPCPLLASSSPQSGYFNNFLARFHHHGMSLFGEWFDACEDLMVRDGESTAPGPLEGSGPPYPQATLWSAFSVLHSLPHSSHLIRCPSRTPSMSISCRQHLCPRGLCLRLTRAG
jgi:hypothetical protein